MVDGVIIVEPPIASQSMMSHIERYRATLCIAYNSIRHCMLQSEMIDEFWQMAAKSVNDTIGSEGSHPTLLVFGALPFPAKKG